MKALLLEFSFYENTINQNLLLHECIIDKDTI